MDDGIEQTITFDGPVFAINERSPEGIPAVELDTTTGSYVVLIFSSREAASKYCYVHRPDAASNIYELSRKTEGTAVVQVGLIKVARDLMRGFPEIKSFLLNHPGAIGRASYIDVEDVAYLGRKKPDEIEADDFHSAMDESLGE